jgi:hypothetical protein
MDKSTSHREPMLKDTIINIDKHNPLKNTKESNHPIIEKTDIALITVIRLIITQTNYAINDRPPVPEEPIDKGDLYDDEPTRYRRPE